MRTLVGIVVLLVALLALQVVCQNTPNVPELSLAALDQEVARLGDGTLLLELYMPGVTEQNAQLEQGLRQTRSMNQVIKIGRIAASPDVLKQWLPRGTAAPTAESPALVVVRHAVVRGYKGPLIGTAIHTFFASTKNSQVVKKFAKSTKRETLDREDTVVVGYFTSEQDKAYRDFEKMARILQEEAFFAATFEAKVAKSLNLRQSGSIMMHEPFEKKVFRDDEEKAPSVTELVRWFDANKKNVLAKVDAKNLFMMFKKWDTFVLGVTSTGAADSSRFLSVLHDVASENAIPGVGFSYLVREELADYATQLGLNNIALPRPIIANMRANKQFVYPDDKDVMSKDDIIAWIEAAQAGSLNPTVKSAPEPADNSGSVYILTANTFDAAVLNSDKNVLVKFFAPWCTHCKDMAPAFEQLGSHYRTAGDNSVRVAEFDTSANDPNAAYNIQGFPTLLFFPRGNATPIPYIGQRTFEAMREFIEANKK